MFSANKRWHKSARPEKCTVNAHSGGKLSIGVRYEIKTAEAGKSAHAAGYQHQPLGLTFYSHRIRGVAPQRVPSEICVIIPSIEFYLGKVLQPS